MTALTRLQAEMADTPFRPTPEELRTALLEVAVGTTSDVLRHGEAYWLTLPGTIWLILKTEQDPQTVTPKAEMLAHLIRDAIAEVQTAGKPAKRSSCASRSSGARFKA